jgi:hypothetical protein
MKNGIELLELMEKVIRESNANKFIDKEASKLNSSQKEKLKSILVRYEEFLRVLDAEAEK